MGFSLCFLVVCYWTRWMFFGHLSLSTLDILNKYAWNQFTPLVPNRVGGCSFDFNPKIESPIIPYWWLSPRYCCNYTIFSFDFVSEAHIDWIVKIPTFPFISSKLLCCDCGVNRFFCFFVFLSYKFRSLLKQELIWQLKK